MIVKTLAFACLLLEFAGGQTKCAHSLPIFLAPPSNFLSLPSTQFLSNKFLWRLTVHAWLLARCLLTSVWVESYCLEKSCLQMEEPVCLEKEEHHVLQCPPSWQALAQIHPPNQLEHRCPCLQQCHKTWQSCPKSLNIARTMAICIDLRRIFHASVSTD